MARGVWAFGIIATLVLQGVATLTALLIRPKAA